MVLYQRESGPRTVGYLSVVKLIFHAVHLSQDVQSFMHRKCHSGVDIEGKKHWGTRPNPSYQIIYR
jgi:hypothetical protein